jgi:hypothetical protein
LGQSHFHITSGLDNPRPSIGILVKTPPVITMAKAGIEMAAAEAANPA